MSETDSILVFLCGLFGGAAVGALVGWRRGMFWGVGVGGILIGLTAAIGAGNVAWDRWQFVAKSERVPGRLVHYDGGPVVEFTPADGFQRTVKGLGGSQSDKGPGDPVPVRFLNGDPSTERVADFQNVWGVVFALCAFAALPLAFGAFFTAMAIGELRARRVRSGARRDADRRPLPRWRRLTASALLGAGNLALVGSLWGFGSSDDLLVGVGRGFLSIASAMLLYAAVTVLRGKADLQITGICLVIALGFGIFGGGALLMQT